MAENETLDLWNRNSKRWQPFLRKIVEREPVEAIAGTGMQCLYQVFKPLVSFLPLDELLAAAERGDHQTIRDIVRRCSKARNYAELFLHYATIQSDPAKLIESVARASVETILDQIEMKPVGEHEQADMPWLKGRRAEIINRMTPEIARLARKVAADPTKKPRMPARSALQKEKDQRDLVSMSLLNPGLGRTEHAQRV